MELKYQNKREKMLWIFSFKNYRFFECVFFNDFFVFFRFFVSKKGFLFQRFWGVCGKKT
jgi:hypothetical protein